MGSGHGFVRGCRKSLQMDDRRRRSVEKARFSNGECSGVWMGMPIKATVIQGLQPSLRLWMRVTSHASSSPCTHESSHSMLVVLIEEKDYHDALSAREVAVRTDTTQGIREAWTHRLRRGYFNAITVQPATLRHIFSGSTIYILPTSTTSATYAWLGH